MPPSPISQLSQELIDRVVDSIVEPSETSTRNNLVNLSSVCHSFHSRSQKLLFSHVTIDVHRIDSFYRLIKANGVIAGYVEDLEVLVTNNDYKWIWEDHRFMRIMDLVAGSRSTLRTLRLRTRHGIQTIEDGKAMIQKFFKPYIAPRITSLHIYGLSSIPIEAIAGCTHLTHLTLSWTEVDAACRTATTDVEIFSPRIYLRNLTYVRSSDALARLLGWDGSRPCLDITQLSVLTIGMDELNSLTFEQRIINTTSQSLQELHITDSECHEINYTIDRFVDLHACFHLRVLELDVSIGRSVLMNDDEDDLATICHILSNIPVPNKLDDFRFVVHVGYWVNQEPEAILGADWDSLRNALYTVLQSKQAIFSLHMDYLPNNYSLIDGGASGYELDDNIDDPSYYTRCQNVMDKLVREKFNAFNSQDALFSIVTSCNISSYYC